jgi:H+/gluconate symporter-like permease
MQQVLEIIINVLEVVKFFVPILLIVFTTIDIFKIIVSKKEDEVKKYRKDIFWKIIYTIIIYMIPVLVPFILNAAEKVLPMNYDNSWYDCWNYVKENKKS